MRTMLSPTQRHALNKAIEARAAEFAARGLTLEEMASELREGLGFLPTRSHVQSAIAATGCDVGKGKVPEFQTRDIVESLCRWAADISLMSGVPLPANVLVYLASRDFVKGTRPGHGRSAAPPP